jgi:hypothetical protein
MILLLIWWIVMWLVFFRNIQFRSNSTVVVTTSGWWFYKRIFFHPHGIIARYSIIIRRIGWMVHVRRIVIRMIVFFFHRHDRVGYLDRRRITRGSMHHARIATTGTATSTIRRTMTITTAAPAIANIVTVGALYDPQQSTTTFDSCCASGRCGY